MIRRWLAAFGITLLLIAIAAHLTQHEDAAENLGNLVFLVLVLLAGIALLSPRRHRAPGDPLDITYVSQDDLSKHSGYTYRVERIANAMRDLGHRVTVVGFATKTPAIEAQWVRLGWKLGRIVAVFNAFFRQSDAVVITSMGAPYNGWFALAVRMTGRDVLYDSQDPVIEILVALLGKHGYMRPSLAYFRVLERLMDRCAVATLVAGPMEIELLRARDWRGPLRTYYNINEAALAAPEPASDLPIRPGWEKAAIVVYVGGLQREMRGIEAQIEAVALARDKGADVRMLLLGFGERAYFEAKAAELLLQDAAAFVSDVPYERLLRVLSTCDFAVSSEPLRYGAQTKMFDYVATGVQLIAVDDDRDVTRMFGDLVALYDGTTADLARRLVQLAGKRSPEERARRRAAGLALLRKLVPESRANLAASLAPITRSAAGAQTEHS